MMWYGQAAASMILQAEKTGIGANRSAFTYIDWGLLRTDVLSCPYRKMHGCSSPTDNVLCAQPVWENAMTEVIVLITRRWNLYISG